MSKNPAARVMIKNFPDFHRRILTGFRMILPLLSLFLNPAGNAPIPDWRFFINFIHAAVSDTLDPCFLIQIRLFFNQFLKKFRRFRNRRKIGPTFQLISYSLQAKQVRAAGYHLMHLIGRFFPTLLTCLHFLDRFS